MTRRERLLAKADRLREWAQTRDERAQATLKADAPLARDWAFITQPGHIPARERINRREDRARESMAKAGAMRGRAAGIEDQAARSIYSDDSDAIQQIEAKIATLEDERNRIKVYNASVRKGARDLSILTEAQKEDLAVTLRVAPYQSKNGAFPSYALTNLGGNIKRLRERITDIERQHERQEQAQNSDAGVVANAHPEYTWGSLTFAEKPSRAVLDTLHAAFWRYSAGTWSGDFSQLPANVENAAVEWAAIQAAITTAKTAA